MDRMHKKNRRRRKRRRGGGGWEEEEAREKEKKRKTSLKLWQHSCQFHPPKGKNITCLMGKSKAKKLGKQRKPLQLIDGVALNIKTFF